MVKERHLIASQLSEEDSLAGDDIDQGVALICTRLIEMGFSREAVFCLAR